MRGSTAPRQRQRLHWRQSCALTLACSAAAWQGRGVTAFAAAPGRSLRQPGDASGPRAKSTRCAEAKSAKDPWKPLVFKMPRPKPPREINCESDEFTSRMRERLKDLKVQVANPSEERDVRATKIDDLINKQAEEAQMDIGYALWRMDRETDRRKRETESPSLEDWKKRFAAGVNKLTQVDDSESDHKKNAPQAAGGFLNMARLQDIDELLAARRGAVTGKALPEAALEEEAEEESLRKQRLQQEEHESRTNIEYLQMLQKKSAAQDRVSRRVVKSPEARKEEYETSKVIMLSATTVVGAIGSGLGSMLYGPNEAIGFAMGSVAALQYLSGLASYTDNAENPLGMALGGRRFLAPVLLVLLVEGWPRLEANIPQVAELHLNPSLPAALLGFFTYNIGKVASRAWTFIK